MDGLEIERVGDVTLVILRAVSNEFRDHIRDRLAEYCYGSSVVHEDQEFYSFRQTMEELLARYESKPHETKVGLAGELIVHMLMPVLHADLTAASAYFNKEERSIKKGFDLTFLSTIENEIWYGEVKSGEPGKRSADAKANERIKTASKSISEMLNDDAHLSRWDAAINDTYLTLQSDHSKSARELLRTDRQTLRRGASIEQRVVLASTVIHELNHCTITSSGLTNITNEINSIATFRDKRVLIIQQEALETIIDELRGIGNA
jgi:hypothetical protein